MLFINDKSYSVSDFVKEINRISGGKVDLSDIKKNPSFIRNNAYKSFDLSKFRRSGAKTPHVNNGDDIQSNFRFFDGDETYFIRYADRQPHKDMSKGGSLIYTPRQIDLPGDDFGFGGNEIELAVYIYVHPSCSDSPFFKEGGTFRYYHDSLSKEVTRKTSKIENLQASLNFVDNMHDSEVKIFALGIGLVLNENWGIDDIRVELKDNAVSNTESFYKATKLETVKFDGMITEAVKNKNIISVNVADTTVWSFNFGSYKGIQITSVPRGVSDNISYLKNYLKENIHKYNEILNNINSEAYSSLKAETYLRSLKDKKVPDSQVTTESDVMTLEEVVDFKSAGDFLMLSHPDNKNSSPTKTKQFLDAVVAGDVTMENIGDLIHNFIAKID